VNLVDFYTRTFQALHKHNVEYLLVGGQAVSHYGYIRSNRQWDLLDLKAFFTIKY